MSMALTLPALRSIESRTPMRACRFYRLVALPFAEMDSCGTAAEGLHRAEMAERDLRDRLLRGECPDVALVAPERCLLSSVEADGALSAPAFAWDPERGALRGWMHSPHVVADVEATRHVLDPTCDVFSDAGSRLVTEGRITGLAVAAWVAPVAEQLSEKYGVEVRISDVPDRPAPSVVAADPIVFKGVLDAKMRAHLKDYFDEAKQTFRPLSRGDRTVGKSYVPTDMDMTRGAGRMLASAAQHFGLEVDSWEDALMEYGPGDSFQEHTDVVDDLAKSLDRTVSFSALLSEPGADFKGGSMVINGEKVKLGAGDLVTFTARTPHSVRPIKTGRRLVWVAFGEVTR